MPKKRQREEDSTDGSSTSSSSGSDSEKREVEKRSKHKKQRKEKEGKEGKKHKKSKDKGKDKKSKGALVRQARAFLEQHLNAGGGGGGEAALLAGSQAGSGPLPRVQVSEVKEQLTDADYFRRHAEFAAFLAEERRTQFNDLSSERARELFSEFVKIWNEGRLAPRFYTGLVAAPLRRTEYRWNIGGGARAGAGPGAGSGGSAAAPSRGMAAYLEDQQAQQAGARLDQRRHDRSRARDLLEEVAPRETGRDKMVADRAARRELARADDDGPGGYVPGGGRGGEDSLMGGGDDFQAAKAREARRGESARQRGLARTEDLAQRSAAYQAKEDEKLAGLRALLSKGPITIAKRT